MANTTKIKRAALVLFIVVSFVLLWFIIDNVRGLLQVTSEWNIASVTLTFIGAFIILGTLVIALITLYSIKKDETPFNISNVNRLRTMAVLLIAYEPYFLINQIIFRKLYPIVLSDGSSIEIHSTISGVALVSGLVVYCISLIFEYGISLQQQFDETL